MTSFWDERFAAPGYKYGTTPNAFLCAQAHRLAPSAAVLLPGDGEGRNSVWLAQRGHPVLAVDSSAVGLAKARALAAERGVALPEAAHAPGLRTEQADLQHWLPAPASADALVLVYVHLPSAWRKAAHRRLAQALRPGGWVLVEAFHPQQCGRPSGGPKDVDMLVTPAQLRDDFAGLADEHLAWEGELVLDEGPGHQGPALVSRWLGRRRDT